jgi:hypothetical protein
MQKSRFCYAMGFLLPHPSPSSCTTHDDDSVQLIQVSLPTDGTVELFAITAPTRKCMDEDEWWAWFQQRTADTISVQALELVTDTLQGRACVARLIDLRLSLRAGGATLDALEHEGLLDAYRAASGGVLHMLDRRPLCMHEALITQLREEQRSTEEELRELQARHDHLEALIGQLQYVLQNVRLVLPLSSAGLSYGDDEEDAEARVLREMMLLLPDFLAIVRHNEQQLSRLEGEELGVVQTVCDLQLRLDEITQVLQHQDKIRVAKREREDDDVSPTAKKIRV